MIADLPPPLPVRSAILCSGGGFPHRRAWTLLAYDCSDGAMRDLLHAMLHDPKWGDDPVCRCAPGNRPVARRVRSRQRATAETASAKEDEKASDQSFGIPDNTLYENVEVPVLIIAGENDPCVNRATQASRRASRTTNTTCSKTAAIVPISNMPTASTSWRLISCSGCTRVRRNNRVLSPSA